MLIRSTIRSVFNQTFRSAVRGNFGGGFQVRDWSVYNAIISTAYTSPPMLFGKDVGADAAITVDAGLTYSLDGGAFTGNAGVRGTAKKIRFRLTSSTDYETLIALDVAIGDTFYTMSVTTRSNLVFPYILPFEVA